MSARGEFVDEATVFVFGGDGGNGVTSFRREKYRPKGGPDGGNGGAGGSVVFRADANVATLAWLARHPHQRAKRGTHGSGDDKHGANAPDLIVAVPEGTLIRDADSGELVADLVRAPAEAIVARGGRGGRGNASLATARRRAPGFAERGEPGEERRLSLELRVLADVGLVGMPNAGKSSLIRRLSAAKPQVADYPFTTLTPHLGVADTPDVRFVIADIPGLIEGAAEGRGLGHAFLRHLERCVVLCFVLDCSEEDPGAALEALRAELHAHDPSLTDRPYVIAANKIDLPEAAERASVLAARLQPVIAVSALNGEGTDELEALLAKTVEAVRAEHAEVPQRTIIRVTPKSDRVQVRREDGAFRVVAPKIERLVARFDLDNEDAVAYLQERFVSLGVEAALSEAGAVEGDEVRIGDAAFEFIPEGIT